jgi:hypothetical protein
MDLKMPEMDVLEKRETSEPVEMLKTEKINGHLRILLAEDNLSNQKVTLQILTLTPVFRE